MQAAAQDDLLFSPAASAEAVVEQLVAGRCGVLVVDLAHLRGDVNGLLLRLTDQFPGLVLLAAGRREDQSSVTPLITQGVIYRYVHKPLSPGRAQQFLQAALRRHRELNEREPFGLATVRELVRVQLWQQWFKHGARAVGLAAGVVATALVASAVRNALQDGRTPERAATSPISASTTLHVPAVVPQPPATSASSPSEFDQVLQAAQRELELGRLNDATRTVREAAAIAPEDVRVAIVATTIGEQLLVRTNVALGEQNFELAQRRLEAARALDREFNLSLPDLNSTANALAEARSAAALSQISTLLDTARSHREAGDLLTPAEANAFTELQRARAIDAENDAVRAEAQALAFALLDAAARELEQERRKAAAELLDRAEELVPDTKAARELRERLSGEASVPTADFPVN
jgi:tetratricopeptide (TPR) repeat protein